MSAKHDKWRRCKNRANLWDGRLAPAWALELAAVLAGVLADLLADPLAELWVDCLESVSNLWEGRWESRLAVV